MGDNINIASIYEQFPTNDDCITHLENVRWGDKPRCPYCESLSVKQLPKTRRYHCNTCRTSFSVTVGTIFHRTHLPLQKWFLAISLFLNAKKRLSARQLSRDLKINKDTAWRMAMKIREAMKDSLQRDLLTGIVEAYETL
ncbi:transposase [Thermodesulfobacteriota bacterium]